MGYTTRPSNGLYKGSENSSQINLRGWLQIEVKNGRGDVVYTSPEISLESSGVSVPKTGIDTFLIPAQSGTHNGKAWSWSSSGKFVQNSSGPNYVEVTDLVTYDGSEANAEFTFSVVTR